MAQDVPFSLNDTINCANNARDADSRRKCVGMSARACADRVNNMASRSQCLKLELDYWEYVLGENMRQSGDKAARERAAGATEVTPEMFDEIDRSWKLYASAICAMEAGKWGGGSGTAFASTACRMKLTGEQALFLYDSWLRQ